MFKKTFCYAIIAMAISTLLSLKAMNYNFVFGDTETYQEKEFTLRQAFTESLRWHRITAVGCRKSHYF